MIGFYRNGRIELETDVDWPEGTRVIVRPFKPIELCGGAGLGDVIVAGFGLAGRCVADFVERAGGQYVIVDSNPASVETQRSLGRRAIEGDISQLEVLEAAGVRSADVLALTIPDDVAVLRAIELAKELNPDVYIIARTTYASTGIKAVQLGADEVIKSEQTVAIQLHDRLHEIISRQVRQTN